MATTTTSPGGLAEPVTGTPPAPAGRRARDPFLDFVRNYSLLSVYLFHTFCVIALAPTIWFALHVDTSNATWIGYPFAFQMSGFFFVGGAVLYRSALRENYRNFVVKRLWRLLVPIAVLVVVLYTINAVMHAVTPQLCGVHHDATRNADVGGFSCTSALPVLQLWFIPFYILFMLLTPLLARIWRRSYGWMLLPLAILGVLAADVVWFAHHGAPFPFYDSIDGFGTWAVPWLLGFLYANGKLRPKPVVALLAAGGLLALHIGLRELGPYTHLATNSAPFHFTTVLGYLIQLSLLLALRPAVNRWSGVTRAGRWFVGWLSTRIYSIYVWHALALMIAFVPFVLLGLRFPTQVGPAFWLERPFFVLAPLVPLVLLVWAFGRLEDIAVPTRLLRTRRSDRQLAKDGAGQVA